MYFNWRPSEYDQQTALWVLRTYRSECYRTVDKLKVGIFTGLINLFSIYVIPHKVGLLLFIATI